MLICALTGKCIFSVFGSLTIKNVDAEPDSTIIESEAVVDNDNYDPSMYYKTRKRSHAWTIKGNFM